MPTVRLLAICNMVAPEESEDTLIIKGAYFDKKELVWVEAENASVPPGTIIASQSTFETYLSPAHLGVWQNMGAVTSESETRHFDLEQVFSKSVEFLGERGQTLASVLRQCQIMTLEDVLENHVGNPPVPITSDALYAHDLLRTYAEEEQVQRWLSECKAIVEGVNHEQ